MSGTILFHIFQYDNGTKHHYNTDDKEEHEEPLSIVTEPDAVIFIRLFPGSLALFYKRSAEVVISSPSVHTGHFCGHEGYVHYHKYEVH